jgi:hypothetical protein
MIIHLDSCYLAPKDSHVINGDTNSEIFINKHIIIQFSFAR